MSVVTQRAGLKTRLDTISGLRVMAGLDMASVPAVIVGEVAVDYDQTFNGASGKVHEFTWTVRLYVSRADDRSAQDKLDAYLDGASGIKAALEADRTLGGAAETLRVTAMSGYGVYEVAGQAYLGAEFSVSVWARGN